MYIAVIESLLALFLAFSHEFEEKSDRAVSQQILELAETATRKHWEQIPSFRSKDGSPNAA